MKIEQQDASGNWVRKATIIANGSNNTTTKYTQDDAPLTVKGDWIFVPP